jgi:hypothetical protein
VDTNRRITGLIDLSLETFFAVCLWPFMGPAAWRGYPGSPYARALLNETRELIDELQGN